MRFKITAASNYELQCPGTTGTESRWLDLSQMSPDGIGVSDSYMKVSIFLPPCINSGLAGVCRKAIRGF